jgi:hypothetical protein
MNIVCSFTKVLWRKDIYCGLCKKYHVDSNFVASKIVFLTEVTKNIFFLRNLVNEHKISRYAPTVFPKNLENLEKIIFRQWMHLHS